MPLVGVLVSSPAAGVLEDAGTLFVGSGEGAFDVAEELVFEECFALAGAVEGDVAGGGAFGVSVDGEGDELFAGAALAGDEDWDVGGGDGFDGAEDAAHRLGLSDDAFEAGLVEFGLEAVVLVAEEDGLGGAVDEVAEDFQVEGLLDEVVDAEFEGGAGGGDIAVGGDEDGLRGGLEALGAFEDFEARVGAVGGDGGKARGREAAGGGHAQVGDDDVEGAEAEFLEGVFDGVDDGADVAGAAESVGHHVGVVGFVFDDQDLGGQVLGLRGWGAEGGVAGDRHM